MSSLQSLSAFRIPWFQISPSALGCLPWFIPSPADTFACSLQQLSLQWFRRLVSRAQQFMRAQQLLVSRAQRLVAPVDVQNGIQPRFLTPLAICSGTPGLHSQSRTQMPSGRFQITSSVVALVLISHHLIAINRF
jgi:hypothetical protein